MISPKHISKITKIQLYNFSLNPNKLVLSEMNMHVHYIKRYTSRPKFTDVKENGCGMENHTGLRNSIRMKRIERFTRSSNSKSLNHNNFGYYSKSILIN